MVTKRQRKLLPVLVSLLMLLNILFAGVTPVMAAGVKTIDIVEVTDFHGQLLDSAGVNYVGAALSKAVKDIKTANPSTLILGGGDLYQGSPLSNVLHGVPVQKVFTDMGMGYTALGNHEFDWGLSTVTGETMVGAGYQILCANAYDKTTGLRAFSPYAVTTIDGVRIAIIGAITTETPTIVLPANIANYNFTDVATEVNTCAAEIRAGGLADVVIALIHEGGGALPTIVSNLHGVDAVFGGHSHTILNTTYADADGKQVPTYIANYNGKGYIDAKMTVDTDNSNALSFTTTGAYKSLTVNNPSLWDLTAKGIIESANATLAPIFNEVIGSISAPLTRTQAGTPYGESQLGNWVSDVIRNSAGADVGMQNNGGIRIDLAAGNITVGTVFNLMPFDNTICTVDMTGTQLKALLNQAVQTSGKGIQLSGIKFTYDSDKPSGDRVTKIVRESDGSTVLDTDVLKVAAPDFLETGGDGFTVFLQGTNFNNSYVLIRDALIADVRARGTVPNIMPGRITNDAGGVAVPMTIAQARAAAAGNAILTGTISVVSGKNVFMQDDTAGICLYNSPSAAVSKGDKVQVTGLLSVYNGLTEITPKTAADVTVISSGNAVTPKVVTVNQINEAVEGQLIKLQSVTLDNIDTAATSTVRDATGSIAIYKIPALTGINPGDIVDVTGAVAQYQTSYELYVGAAADVVKISSPPAPPASITVLATSDMHGNIYNWDYAAGKIASTSQAVGLATVSTFVNSIRAANPNVILVDNGDTIQGTPLSYYYDMIDKTSEYPMMKAMGIMKYDSWTLGNHEYNYGLDTLNRIIGDATTEGISVLSANTYKDDGTNFVKPYITRSFTVNGKAIKVGILGLTTKTIPSWEDAAHYAGLSFKDLVDEAKKWVPVLKTTEACDIVIVVAHSGEEGAADVIPENQIKAVATGVSGIDAIVAGHAHSNLNDLNLKNPDGKTVPVVEPYRYGSYVSQIDINIDGTGNITGLTTKNVKMDPAKYVQDPAITTALQSYQDQTLQYIQTVLGTSTGEFTGAGQYVVPTAIMDLVNKVQLDAAGTQLSIAAPLSASAYIPQGNITIKDIMGVYVYENFLYGVKMTGKQLKNWMEYSVRYYKQINDPALVINSSTDFKTLKDTVLNIADYNLDQLYGATYDVDLTEPACTVDSATGLVVSGSRIKNLKINGRLVKDTDTFTVAINNYRYNGGGGFMKAIGLSNTAGDYPNVVTYDSAKVLGDDGQVRSLMMSYIQKNQTISPTCSNSWKLSAIPVVQTVEATGVTLNKTTLNLKVGETDTLVATVLPESATNKSVTWSSSDTAIATVDNGVVTAVGPGSVTITATTVDGGFTASAAAEIVQPVTGIILNSAKLDIRIGNSQKLVATVLPLNATNKGVIWKSSNEKVATVADGVVTALKTGKAIITVTTVDGNFTATAVVNAAIYYKGIVLSDSSVSMKAGQTRIIVAVLVPGSSIIRNGIWESSNTSVVTVKNGVIKAVGKGTAIVTVTTADGKYQARAVITVAASKTHGKEAA